MTTPMMLDGAEVPALFGRWENEESNDALPYADVLPEGWRAGVDQLVQEEMRRMKKRPKDYLAEMVPAREIDWRGCPLLRKEFERVEKGGGRMPPPDATRYELAPPPKSKRGDEGAWESALRDARAHLEHQTTRAQNLELAVKFAPDAWRTHNASLEAAISAYETELAAVRAEIEHINTERSLQQTAAAREIGKLEQEWYATAAKCFALDGVVMALEFKAEAIKAGETNAKPSGR
jgi:pre-mRNA-splicing factor SPF27